jgi:hypothetical protein
VPDFDAVEPAIWDRCQLLYVCSPGNPTGAVLDLPTLTRADRARHRTTSSSPRRMLFGALPGRVRPAPGPAPGRRRHGQRPTFERCVCFHSLSKRSNAPGLRSGFVAGDADLIERFFAYRTYHGCAMPPPPSTPASPPGATRTTCGPTAPSIGRSSPRCWRSWAAARAGARRRLLSVAADAHPGHGLRPPALRRRARHRPAGPLPLPRPGTARIQAPTGCASPWCRPWTNASTRPNASADS